MKFWELISAFREEPTLLEASLAKGEWNKYLNWYEQYEQLVKNKNREILDSIVPDELLQAIALNSNQVFYFYPARSILEYVLKLGK